MDLPACSSSHQGDGRAWTRFPSTSPLGVGLDQIPLNFPLGCGPGDPPGPGTPHESRLPGSRPPMRADPPGADPPGSRHPPNGDLLQGMLGYHLKYILGYHPSVNRMRDRCKNITLPQTLFADGKDDAKDFLPQPCPGRWICYCGTTKLELLF